MCCLLPYLLPSMPFLNLSARMMLWSDSTQTGAQIFLPPFTPSAGLFSSCDATGIENSRNGNREMEYNRYNFITFNTFDKEKGSYFALSIVFYIQIFDNTFSDVHKIGCEYDSAHTGAIVRLVSSPHCDQFHIGIVASVLLVNWTAARWYVCTYACA